MSGKKEKTTRRKPYQKPQLEQVQLVPEEAVLTACKNGNQAGCNPHDKAAGS